MQSMYIESPAVIECVSLPCLRILQHIIRPAAPTSKKNKVIQQGLMKILLKWSNRTCSNFETVKLCRSGLCYCWIRL